MFNRRNFLGVGLGTAAATYLRGSDSPAVTPEKAMAELVDGNRRFLAGHPLRPNASLTRARLVGKDGQRPRSIVLTCSDSRVPPEILFDQGIGDMFVIRVAGNVANGDEIASIEYAVEHFGVPVCVVLGHSSCGAVSAVVDGGKLPKDIEHLVEPIQRPFREVKASHPRADRLELIRETVRLNVQSTCTTLSEAPGVLADSVRAGRLQVKGGVYDLETSRVEWVRR